MCDPVGVAEIAERLGARQQTVAMWHYRSKRGEMARPMPPPKWHVSGMAVWNWPTIERWARATGRVRVTG